MAEAKAAGAAKQGRQGRFFYGWWIVAGGFLIMSTYIAAQVLLAHAVAQHAQPGRAGTRTPLLRARAAR